MLGSLGSPGKLWPCYPPGSAPWVTGITGLRPGPVSSGWASPIARVMLRCRPCCSHVVFYCPYSSWFARKEAKSVWSVRSVQFITRQLNLYYWDVGFFLWLSFNEQIWAPLSVWLLRMSQNMNSSDPFWLYPAGCISRALRQAWKFSSPASVVCLCSAAHQAWPSPLPHSLPSGEAQ